MIRVIYRWSVEPGAAAAFEKWWHDGTIRIRSTYAGALGSVLLRPHSDRGAFVAIASWRSEDDLLNFWRAAGGAMFDGAQLLSAEILDELDDLTVPPPA